jgi:hypothetical protein
MHNAQIISGQSKMLTETKYFMNKIQVQYNTMYKAK